MVKLASGFPTFTMGLMILSTYLIPVSKLAAETIYYSAVITHLLLIVLFSLKFIKKFNIKKVFPSYFIVYVGIVVASVTAPAYNNLFLGQILFYLGFASYIILLPVISYRVFKVKEIPEAALPTITIFTAPAGLCLAGYLSSFPVKNIFILSCLLALTIISVTAVILYLPKMIAGGFYPSFSAFTFPFVITGIGLKMSNNYLKNNFNLNFINYPARMVEFLAVIILVFVFLSYFKFLFRQNTFSNSL
nr:TDT family transporter [Halanaerobium sp. ST460_2HS_T2]